MKLAAWLEVQGLRVLLEQNFAPRAPQSTARTRERWARRHELVARLTDAELFGEFAPEKPSGIDEVARGGARMTNVTFRARPGVVWEKLDVNPPQAHRDASDPHRDASDPHRDASDPHRDASDPHRDAPSITLACRFREPNDPQKQRGTVLVLAPWLFDRIPCAARFFAPTTELGALGLRVGALRFEQRFPVTEPLVNIALAAERCRLLRAVVSWMKERGRGPVIVLGTSLGALDAALLATTTTGLDGCILERPLASLAEPLPLSQPDLARLYQCVSPLARSPTLPPERLRVVAARDDRIAPPDRVREVAGHFAVDPLLVQGSHLFGHGRRQILARLVTQFCG